MRPERGDVVLVLFPDSSLKSAKRRPALVVQANGLATQLPQVIVAMISSNPHRAGHPSRIEIGAASPAGKQMGLRIDSIVMSDNLATILVSELDRAIGTCPLMSAVDNALRHTLGL